jgi:glucose-6-phosphate 1-epimerase
MSATETLSTLSQKFAIPGIAAIEAGQGGLPKIGINTESASAEIYLHGAQVTSWRPRGEEEVIFLSGQSHWQAGKAIRGGIPVCFPWFRSKADDPKAPSHGFARTKAWELTSITRHQDDVTVTLETHNDESTKLWWPYAFNLTYHITVGPVLQLELVLVNTGATPLRFEEALHTYFRVGDAERAQVSGLDGVTYLDNVDANRSKTQAGNVTFSGPLDNAYLATEGALELIDPVLKRRIRTEKRNSHTTVVWNPWKEGAQSLADLSDDEWKQFACVEACNIRDAAVLVDPGAEHRMTAIISAVPE